MEHQGCLALALLESFRFSKQSSSPAATQRYISRILSVSHPRTESDRVFLPSVVSNSAADYTAGPLFWIFAENAIAITGACLPTLAPLWTRKPELASKRWTWFKRSWKGSKSDHYDNLESQYQNNTSGDNTSIYPLVARGPATNIHADTIALEDRPQQGIQVRTTLSSNYRQQETSSTT